MPSRYDQKSKIGQRQFEIESFIINQMNNVKVTEFESVMKMMKHIIHTGCMQICVNLSQLSINCTVQSDNNWNVKHVLQTSLVISLIL